MLVNIKFSISKYYRYSPIGNVTMVCCHHCLINLVCCMSLQLLLFPNFDFLVVSTIYIHSDLFPCIFLVSTLVNALFKILSHWYNVYYSITLIPSADMYFAPLRMPFTTWKLESVVNMHLDLGSAASMRCTH